MNGMSKTVGVVFLVLIFFIGIFAPALAVSDEIENITIKNYSENVCNNSLLTVLLLFRKSMVL